MDTLVYGTCVNPGLHKHTCINPVVTLCIEFKLRRPLNIQRNSETLPHVRPRSAIRQRKQNKMTLIRAWRFITLMLTSLSLSLSMTHLLELPQRMQFDQQLWVRVTVFENVYRWFGSVGAAFEITAILTAIMLVFLVRKRGSTFYWTLGGAIFLILAFVSWIVFVAPMNAEFARWLTNPVPADWTRYRDQWEYAHQSTPLLKSLGLVCS